MISMSEVNALVEKRIAEHDAQTQREAERVRQAFNPISPPAAPINAPPEVVQALADQLDACGGDVEDAVRSVVKRLERDVQGRAVDPKFRALFYTWAFASDVMFPLGLVVNLIKNIERQREKAVA